ncbi:aminoglycoside phosphotransferase family protein [uncultured Pelagimonas sp.]|uniref:aminoglycoside phosphotransferase family protein n=1 Tax=uncultured Pelagimonas sp. TaxID=1618102 RepID=UPI0026217613|nr:aminoglycoside phosphotransferase family protein [uncultured Pelagimonas sp.]
MSGATHLTGEAAYEMAMAALGRLWPDWSGELTPLKPLTQPLRATPFRLSGGAKPAVIKVWGPGNASKAAAQAARQEEVALAMVTGENRGVPVFGFDTAACALLMQDVSGDTIDHALEETPDRLNELATRAGTWLRDYHALSLRPAPFRPAGHIAWLEKLRTQIADGHREVADPDRFCRLTTQICDSAMTLRKRPATKVITHRDLTLGNLLVDDQNTLWGIDFENNREDEPLRDLFTLAVDLIGFTSNGLQASETYRRLTLAYGDRETDPEVHAFLFHCFALGVWANTPATPSKRQAKRFRVVQWMLQNPSTITG